MEVLKRDIDSNDLGQQNAVLTKSLNLSGILEGYAVYTTAGTSKADRRNKEINTRVQSTNQIAGPTYENEVAA